MSTPTICSVVYPWKRTPDRQGSYHVDELLLGRKRDTVNARHLHVVDKWIGGSGEFDLMLDTSMAQCAERVMANDFGIVPVIEHLEEAGIATIETPTSETEIHFFFAKIWNGEVVSESREMRETKWFPVARIPYEEMSPVERHFCLPTILHGAIIRGQIISRMRIICDEEMRIIGFDPFKFIELYPAA